MQEIKTLDSVFEDGGEPPQWGEFYSVFVPADVRQQDTQLSQYIFNDKDEAMKMMKKSKKARFKYFDCLEEAMNFAKLGAVDISSSNIDESIKSEQSNNNEKLSPFRGPKPQDMVKLRSTIESGNFDAFKQTVWENPRYLVSNGDTPSILQEGFRYNALHIAAKAKNGQMAELILNTISNAQFVQLLYGDDQNENINSRIQILLDLYLNMPDKGLNETPLHFAAKFGADGVIQVLVTFPQCDRNLKNKYGQTPEMIICHRCDSNEATSTLKRKIAMHLENCYYVPVLRAEDNSVPALIGEPFSPGRSTIINNDILSPRMEIHAYAGPMNKEGAEKFRKVWRTPPRTSTPKRKRTENSDLTSLRYTDPAKGLERVGQKLATKFNVSWQEFWGFLDCFIDITSDDGLILLENFFKQRFSLIENSLIVDDLSSIADLCLQMQNCNLCENFSAYLCVEKACNVFANRVATEILHRISNDFHIQVNSFELHIKQVELLVLSYMEDYRFRLIKFAQIHSRLALLISQKLLTSIDDNKEKYLKYLENFVTECVKAFDCFSSDDEGNYLRDSKATSSKKQLICLIQNIIKHFNQDININFELEDESICREIWSKTDECRCIFHLKKIRKNHRMNSFRFGQHLRKQLFKDVLVFEMSSSDDDEEFFTPPSSPSQLLEEFEDVPLSSAVYVEDDIPTKTDCYLFKALTLADFQLSSNKYPNIYRWYHNINLFPEEERDSWPQPKQKTHKFNPLETPNNHSIDRWFKQDSPPTSWLRITGANSPSANHPKK